jgi:hypothetical protein
LAVATSLAAEAFLEVALLAKQWLHIRGGDLTRPTWISFPGI